jgi:hypothetical protein
MATEWLMRLSGADYTGVTYGGRGILQGLVAGDIHLVFGGLAAATPTLQTGKAKIIAVTSAQRMTKLPDVPAVAETFPGYEVVIYYGFVAPAGTPPDIVNRLNAAIGESIQALTPQAAGHGQRAHAHGTGRLQGLPGARPGDLDQGRRPGQVTRQTAARRPPPRKRRLTHDPATALQDLLARHLDPLPRAGGRLC